ncbi:MAG: hypothetical protein O0X93_01705, partial [Methanocorpusculum sp.]|nr:hypothetical protein [Methanocorpusculum sp.]MDE2524853.1 hypothetical protein [Methanocorpusculum sp.]
MTRNYIFIILILTTLVFVSPAAASPYANILEDPTRSTEDKLADFAAAIGWRDDLGTYQMEMANYEMQVAAQEAEIAEAKQLQQELTATFGLDASRLAEQAETVDIPTAPYTEAEIAALDAESAAYYSAFAANYVATAAFPGGGSGTAADPYIITNRAELEAINDDLTAHYKLANNIDLGGSATPWITIADRYAPFTGVLDGSGYKISNIYMDEGGVSANKMSGLLGGLGVGAHIYDIGITGTGVNMGLGGLLYGINTGGIVDRCYARGEVEVGLGQMAGLLGGNSYGSGAKLRDCYAIGSVSNTGGVASVSASILQGSNYAGTVERCYAQGDVVSKNYASGLIGGGIHNLGQAYCRNSVSLASTLSAGSTESTFTGRVGGTYYQYFQNVYAAADMTLNGATISGGTTTNHNGADVSPETYHTQAFWQNTLGWDFTNTWYWDTTDQLPKLRAFLHGPTITSVSANPTTGGVDTEITLSATVTDATSMQWQYSTNGGGSWQDIVGANAATATWTPGATGSYEVRLQATNSDGTTTSDTVSVIIYAAPTVSATVSPTAGPVQQMLTLTGSVTDPAPGTTAYQWQSAPAETGEWTDISGATALTYQYAYDGAPGTTWYRLAATGTGGTAYSTAVSYTAYAMPTVTAAVTPDQGPLTQSLTLSAVINDPGPGETTYQWQTSSNGGTTWTSIDGAITNPYTYTFTGSAGQHQFRIIATGTGGSAASDPVTYTAIAPPVFSTATVSPSTGTYPLVVTFTADATDTTAYQWQMSENNGQTWTDIASTATGQYTHATPGTYLWRVTATGIGGTTTSETITITVTSPPPVFSSVSVSPLAGGLNQEFTLTAAAADTTGYQWQSAP